MTECVRYKPRDIRAHRIWNPTGLTPWECIFTALQGLILQAVRLPGATAATTQPLPPGESRALLWTMPNLEFAFAKLKGFAAKRMWLVGDANNFRASEHTLTGRAHLSAPSSIAGDTSQCLLTTVFYNIYSQYQLIQT